MTVTFQVPSGSVLPSQSAARVFTSTTDVTFACVRYRLDPVRPVERPVEVVWMNGAFVYPYSLASTKVGNVYTVVRQGGWSEDLELHVEPVAPAVSAGFGLLYEQDFATLPNQTLAPGANVIGGQRWWHKGTFALGDESLSIVNGVGLRLRQRSLTAFDYDNNDLPPCMMLDLADLEGYDPDAPLIVQYRFAEVDLAYPSNVSPMCTLVTASGNSSVITNAERTGVNGRIEDKNGGTWRAAYSHAGNAGSVFGTVATGLVDALVFQLMSTVGLRRHLMDLQVTTFGAWPAPDSTYSGHSAQYVGLPLGADATPSQGFAFWAQNHVGPPFGMMQHSLRAIRVYQTGA